VLRINQKKTIIKIIDPFTFNPYREKRQMQNKFNQVAKLIMKPNLFKTDTRKF